MKFPFFSKSTESAAAAPSWPWPACGGNPRTLSFRVAGNDIFKTINSAYLDDDTAVSELESCNVPDEDCPGADETAVVGALRADRLFFQPGESSSILAAAKETGSSDDGEAVSILALESRDPYADFRSSMEEMVEAHELKNWECLEELLACYLRVNSKSNHGYIVGAFVDLLVRLAVSSTADAADADVEADASPIDENCSSSSTTTTHNSFTSPLSFSSSSTTATYSSASPRLSSPENEDPMTSAAGDKEFCTSASSSSSGV